MYENGQFQVLVGSLLQLGLQVTDFQITLFQEIDQVR